MQGGTQTSYREQFSNPESLKGGGKTGACKQRQTEQGEYIIAEKYHIKEQQSHISWTQVSSFGWNHCPGKLGKLHAFLVGGRMEESRQKGQKS